MKKLSKDLLRLLIEKIDDGRKNINYDKKYESINKWIDIGSPHMWKWIEGIVSKKHKSIDLFYDTGHGWMAVFEDGEFMGYGKDEIITDDFIVINKDFYNSTKHIWQ